MFLLYYKISKFKKNDLLFYYIFHMTTELRKCRALLITALKFAEVLDTPSAPANVIWRCNAKRQFMCTKSKQHISVEIDYISCVYCGKLRAGCGECQEGHPWDLADVHTTCFICFKHIMVCGECPYEYSPTDCMNCGEEFCSEHLIIYPCDTPGCQETVQACIGCKDHRRLVCYGCDKKNDECEEDECG